jgi:hypothetical protein
MPQRHSGVPLINSQHPGGKGDRYMCTDSRALVIRWGLNSLNFLGHGRLNVTLVCPLLFPNTLEARGIGTRVMTPVLWLSVGA